nr:ribonuclease H-like domain-containing protein [Tanacetum cinerariifolium]
MTGNISYLTNFKEHDGGYVAFGGGAKGGKITSKGTIRIGKIDFEDVYFVKELQFNIFSVSQMCNKKNSVLFTNTEYFMLSPNIKLADESHVLLKVPKKNNMHSFDMNNIVPQKDLTFLLANATIDESMLWHMRLVHINFKDINKLVKDNPQNGVAERRNMSLIKAARTMLADSKLLTTFWAEAVMQNRVLVVKPQYKTPYELFKGRSPTLSFTRPFSKAFRVYNTRTRKVEENLHITFLKNKPMIVGGGPEWLFNIDDVSESMNYAPVPADNSLFNSSSQDSDGHNKDKHGPSQESECDTQERPNAKSSTKTVNTAGPVNTATLTYFDYLSNPLMPNLEDTGIFDDAYDNIDEGAEADYNNLETMEPKKVTQALDDESWVKAMQKELLHFKLLNVWTSVDLSNGKKAIGTTWVFRNKRDQRGIVVRNKASCVKSASTSMETYKPLSKDANDKDVDVHLYRFQVQPKVSHMHAVKQIFRYLKGQHTLGLWYPKDLPLELIAYSNSDNAGASLDRKYTTSGYQFLGLELKEYLINDGYADLVQHFWNTASSKTMNSGKQIHVIVDGKAIFISESAVRSDLLFDDEDGITCLTNDEIFENLALMGYESLSTKLTFQKDTSGSPRCQETIGGTFAQTRSERVLEHPNEPPLTEGHTSGCREGRIEHTVKLTDIVPPTPCNLPLIGGCTSGGDEGWLKLEELMNLCTILVKKLEIQLKQKRSRVVIHSSDDEEPSVDIEDSPKQGRMVEELEIDKDVNLVSEQREVHKTAELLKDDDDATLAETLLNIKRSTTKDKGKGIM